MKNLELAAEAARAVYSGGGRPVDAIAAASFVTGQPMAATANALIAAGVLVIASVGGSLEVQCK